MRDDAGASPDEPAGISGMLASVSDGIDTAWQAGHAAWPKVAVDRDHFAAFAAG